VLRKVIEIRFGLSTQHYFLVERLSGEYGTGAGEEYSPEASRDPNQGIYIPIWMPIADMWEHENVYPVDVRDLVSSAHQKGWPEEPLVVDKHPK
jgi:hypothetical protein